MDSPYELLPFARCTGCATCMNVCPVDAITMVPMDDKGVRKGYDYPYVDPYKCTSCGLCVKRCPVLNMNTQNEKTTESYSVVCEEYRKQCSSGGVFGALATMFVRNGGVVVGAKMDNNFDLHETMVDNESDLVPLFRSKYVQSKVGNIYRDVREKLENGAEVLFCSTPCQVAGLKSYLGHDYDNLYTIDLICHGVASSELLRRLLKEEYNGKKATEVVFRCKKKGWKADLNIVFSDGTEKYEDNARSPFYDAFLRCNVLRESCFSCPYTTLYREGDISIGDNWGFKKDTHDDGNGISAVLVNNTKGKRLIEMFSESGASIVDYPLEKVIERNKNLYKPSMKRGGYNRFIDHSRNRPIAESTIVAYGKYDVGLVVMTSLNYGNNLTNWSLFNAVKSLGYTAVVIPRNIRNPAEMFEKSPYSRLDVFYGKRELANEFCKMFILGSDQTLGKQNILTDDMFLIMPWVRSDKYKTAYSSSFGLDTFNLPEDHLPIVHYYLNRFDRLSTREPSGVEILRDMFDLSAEQAIDSVFLSCKEDYMKLASNKKGRIADGPYIAVYMLVVSKTSIAQVKKIASEMGIDKVYCIGNMGGSSINDDAFVTLEGAKIDEFLYMIGNSSMFLTDSFHGMCFSLIMNKQFYLLKGAETRSPARLNALLKTLGLNDRLISKMKNITEINYTGIQPILDAEREKGLELLKGYIDEGLSSRKQLEPHDVFSDQVKKLECTVDFQNRLIEKMVFSKGTLSVDDCIELGDPHFMVSYALNLVSEDVEGNLNDIIRCYSMALTLDQSELPRIRRTLKKETDKAYRFEVIGLLKRYIDVSNL